MKSLTHKVMEQIAKICDVSFPVRTVADWQEVLNIAAYSGYDVADVTSKINSQAPIAVEFISLDESRSLLAMIDINHKHCKTHNHHLQDFETRLKMCGNIPN